MGEVRNVTETKIRHNRGKMGEKMSSKHFRVKRITFFTLQRAYKNKF